MRIPALLVVALVATRAHAGGVTGQVQLLEKGGASASDLSDVVVYLEGVKTAKPKQQSATVVMKAKNFTPHVVVIPVGGTVEFPNEDPIFHNAFSVQPENKFDLELYKRPKTGSWTFKNPGVVNVYCNIHPQMAAYIRVVDGAWALTGPGGEFAIDGLAPGRYTVKVWHERGGERELTTLVRAGTASDVRLVLDASRYQPAAHKNKHGDDYPPAVLDDDRY